MRHVVLVVVSAMVLSVSAPAAGTSPTVDDLISLKRAGSPVISPDGRLVAYTVRETNWDDDRYETEIWIADVAAGTTRQLPNAPKSSSAPACSRSARTARTNGSST